MLRRRGHAMNQNLLRNIGLWRRALCASGGLVCAAGLWGAVAVAHAAPARPTLTELPIASLPRQDSLKAPERIETSSEDLPFEVVVPPERRDIAKLKKQAGGYGTYQHWLTLKALTNDVCLRSAAATRVEDRDQVVIYGYQGYPSQMVSVRAERLSLDRGPALVVDDFLVEPISGHVKHAATTRVPLLK